MKSLSIIFLIILICFKIGNAQNINYKISSKSTFTKSSEIQSFKSFFTKKGFKSKNFIKEGTFNIKSSSKDKAELNLTMETYLMQDKQGKEVYLVRIFDHLTNESKAWSESDEMIYEIKNNIISQRQISNTNKNSNSTASDCVALFLKPGITSCSEAINCAKSNKNKCETKNKQWKKIACYLTNCGFKFGKCLINVVQFIICLLNNE